jgi:uncharacterized protein with FMN-binding domain
MTRRLTAVIWAAVLPMFAAGVVLADVVHLKSGQKYEGAAEEKDGTVVLKLERGSLTFTKDQVDRVEKSAPPWEVYEEKAKELKREDVSGHLDLAKWCKAHGLPMRMKQELEHVISVDPESTEARALLGHKKVGDKWLTPEEQQPVKAPPAEPAKDPGKDPGKDPVKPPSGTAAAGPPDGTYRCKSRGYVDDLEVEVVVVLGMISEVKVTEHKENGKQAQVAIKEVPLRIIDRQSVKVDGTSEIMPRTTTTSTSRSST